MTHTVRVQILGPVRAWRGEQEIPLGPPQQRWVLVLLAAADGHPVPVSTIIDSLWTDSPPPSAVNVVQTYIKRLRRVVDPGRPARGVCAVLASVGSGYALRPEAALVDLRQFQEHLQRARTARRAGDQRAAMTALSRALPLWHGPPASDLPLAWQHPRLLTVAKDHATAACWLAEAALACREAEEAVPAVEQALATRPYDEPLLASMVRLYHATGRRTDAVRVFHEARQRLREAFGFDPGPELDAAYRALLREDRRPAAAA